MKNKFSIFTLMIALAMPLSLLSMNNKAYKKKLKTRKRQNSNKNLTIITHKCILHKGKGDEGIQVSISPTSKKSEKKKKRGNTPKKAAQKTKNTWY